MTRTDFTLINTIMDNPSFLTVKVFDSFKGEKNNARSTLKWLHSKMEMSVGTSIFKKASRTIAKRSVAFCLLFISTLAYAQDFNSLLTREEALEDIQFLKSALEKSHPGLYRFTDKETMDKTYSRAMSEITNINSFEFHKEISHLLSLIHCGHTQASLPNRMSDFYTNNLLRIPLDISFLNGKMVVAKDYSDQKIERGSKIISIDGMKSENIVSELFETINGDGYIQSFKYKYLELLFWLIYPQYFSKTGLPQHYTIEYKKPFDDTINTVVLNGLSEEEIEEKRIDQNEDSKPRSLTIKNDYALMTIKTFTGGRTDKYYSFLRKSFKKINESGIDNLIIDLRDNGGGADDYGIELVTYLADSDFKYFDRIEVTEHYASQNNRVKSENGMHYWSDHPGLSKWSPNENRFKGKVYVLINGLSFSTTADVASVLFDNDWATFIGQETGGGAYGNTSGHSTSIRLPNSKIVVDLPYWMYFTALNNKYPKGRGVIPDYTTSPSLREFINKVDVEMEKAISLIRQN